MNHSIFEILARGSRQLLLASAAAALTSGCASAPTVSPIAVKVNLPSRTVMASPPAKLHLAQTIDARPAALRTDFGPHLESHYSLLVGSGAMFINGANVEGPTLRGDKLLTLTGPGGQVDSRGLMDALVGSLLGAGHAPLPGVLELGEIDEVAAIATAAGVGDGVVVVPILDQLDLTRLSAENSMMGGSSSETSRSPTTVTYTHTSGAATLTGATPNFANVRVRLLVLELRSGRLQSSRWVFGRGAGSELGPAIDRATVMLADGLTALWTASPGASAPAAGTSAIESPTPTTTQGSTP